MPAARSSIDLLLIRRLRAPGRPPWLLPLLVGAIATAIFACLAHEAAIEEEHTAMELQWLLSLAASRTNMLTAAMVWVHRAHDFAIAGLLAVFLTTTISRKRWGELGLLVAAVPGGMLLNMAVKNILHRPRPGIESLVNTHGYTFPSSHAIGVAVVAAWAIHAVWTGTRSRIWRGLVIALAGTAVLVVAFSRVYLGAHYPSDVLAGLVEAVAWFCLCLAAANAMMPPSVDPVVHRDWRGELPG